MTTRQKTGILLAALLLALALPATLAAWAFALPAQYGETFLGELGDKCDALDEAESPRLILVGGSAAAFGVDSALLAEYLPEYTPVNFGLYAALGTTVMLELSEDSVRERDIVIVLPEQQEQTLSCYFNAETLWQGLDGRFDLLARLDSSHWGQLFGTLPAFAGRKFSAWLSGTPYEGTGVYARSSFNEYGEISRGLCPNNVMPGMWDSSTPIRLEEDVLDAEFVSVLNDYADTLTARGATVWYHFSPMNALAVTEESDPDGYYDYLQSNLHCTVIGNPKQCILDAEWFYDTNFHLNDSGKTVFTRLLIRDIKAMLGDSSPTDIDLPEKPAPAEETVYAGDNSDAGCFLWSSDGESASITGLTAEGRVRTELTVPAEADGLPVTTVCTGAFSEGTALRRVVLQANIATIQDGAFDGCAALTEIVLENADPSACRVGQELLRGTNAQLLVPGDALTDYRLSYSWAVYASRISAAS